MVLSHLFNMRPDEPVFQPGTRDLSNVRCGSRLRENSEVKLSHRTFVSNALNKKSTALARTAEGRRRTHICRHPLPV